jgi:hypothetical protein
MVRVPVNRRNEASISHMSVTLYRILRSAIQGNPDVSVIAGRRHGASKLNRVIGGTFTFGAFL